VGRGGHGVQRFYTTLVPPAAGTVW
jgi:hypothetical protein